MGFRVSGLEILARGWRVLLLGGGDHRFCSEGAFNNHVGFVGIICGIAGR